MDDGEFHLPLPSGAKVKIQFARIADLQSIAGFYHASSTPQTWLSGRGVASNGVEIKEYVYREISTFRDGPAYQVPAR